MSNKVHATLVHSNFDADSHFSATLTDPTESWTFDGPTVALDHALRPERTPYDTTPLEVSVIRIKNDTGGIEDDLYLGNSLFDPQQFLAPSLSAAFAVHRAGLAGVPLPSEVAIDDIAEARQYTGVPSTGPHVMVNACRCIESTGEQHREVEIQLAEPDPSGRFEYLDVASAVFDIDQAREMAAGLLLAIAAHDADAARQEGSR